MVLDQPSHVRLGSLRSVASCADPPSLVQAPRDYVAGWFACVSRRDPHPGPAAVLADAQVCWQTPTRGKIDGHKARYISRAVETSRLQPYARGNPSFKRNTDPAHDATRGHGFGSALSPSPNTSGKSAIERMRIAICRNLQSGQVADADTATESPSKPRLTG